MENKEVAARDLAHFLCSFSFDILQGTAKPQSRRGKAIVLKNVPMEISWFFMFYLINVGHILKV